MGAEKITWADRIAIFFLVGCVFFVIFFFRAGLWVCGMLQCNKPAYKEIIRLEKITLENKNYLPLRYRFNDWLRIHNK